VRGAERDVLVATVRGVIAIDEGGRERHLSGDDGLIGEQVQDAAARAGAVAYATNRGVTVIGPDGASRSLYALQGLANNHCYAVAFGEDGRLYVGTLGGLSILSPDLVVERSLGAGPEGLRAAWVTALAATREGIYVGTYGGGVALVGPGGAAVDTGAVEGSILRIADPSESAHSRQPSACSTQSPSAKAGLRETSTRPTAPPVIASPRVNGATYERTSFIRGRM